MTEENKQCGFKTGPTQSELYKHRKWPEAGNSGYRHVLSQSICVAKTKVMISFAVTAAFFSHMHNVAFLMMWLTQELTGKFLLIEPPHGKTSNLHRRKTKAQISFALTAKLISAFVFATRIVQFLLYLTPKFQASSHLLCWYSLICVGPGWKPHYWFSHEVAQLTYTSSSHVTSGFTTTQLRLPDSFCIQFKIEKEHVYKLSS